MTKQQEQLSAFMDGEADNASCLETLTNDAELRAKWSRYHTVRSVMRKEIPAGEFADISQNIAAALEKEPTVLAPAHAGRLSLLRKVSAKVVPFARQSGQLAVAASVAAAVILGVQTYNQPETTEPFVTAPTVRPQGGLSPVSLNQTRVLPSQSKQEVMQAKRQINALIADHEQQMKLKAAEQKDVTTQEDSSKYSMRWTVFFPILLCAAFAVAAQTPDTSEDSPARMSAKDWLERLSTLVTTKNFEASYVLFRKGQETIPYLWRHGVMQDGTHMEQLNLQNGPGREFIRVENRVSVFEPDVPPYSVYGNSINGPIPSALLQNEPQLYEGYEFVVVGRSRISGRPAQQIRIVSLDNTRFGYQLWLDEETGMLLKLNMLDQQGGILEQIQMSTFRITREPHEYFARVNQARLPQIMALPPTRTGDQNWDMSFLPVGMKEIKHDTRRLAVTGQVVQYRLYSDGLTDVSVYVEPADQSLNTDVALRHGLSTFLSRTVGATQVTVIGEIPPDTANAIASSLTVRNNP